MTDLPRTLRIADLIGSSVVTADGGRVGRVADVVATRQSPHRVTELDLGTAG
jgi:ribosomal 30S subunit maturation factor RimM